MFLMRRLRDFFSILILLLLTTILILSDHGTPVNGFNITQIYRPTIPPIPISERNLTRISPFTPSRSESNHTFGLSWLRDINRPIETSGKILSNMQIPNHELICFFSLAFFVSSEFYDDVCWRLRSVSAEIDLWRKSPTNTNATV